MKKRSYVSTVLTALLLATLISADDDVIQWTFQTGKAIYTSPVVHEGNLYFGGMDSVFYAVSVHDGAEIWRFKTDNPIQSNAAIFEGGILFESGNQLYALNFQGNLLWQFPLYTEPVTNQIDAWDFFHSSPNIVNGNAYIGTEQGWIYGVNVQTGAEVFKVQTPNQGTIRVMPVADENRLYTGDWIGILTCHDLNSGNVLWQYDTRTDGTYAWTNAIQTPLMVQDGRVFFAGRSGLAYALNSLTGEKLWTYSQAGVWIVGGTVIADGLIYYGSSNQSLLYALDIQTGQSSWNLGIDFRMWNAPLVSGDYLFFGARSFYAVNRHTGEVMNRMFFKPEDVHKEPLHIWYWAADYYGKADELSNFHSSAVEADGKIIVGCDDGKLYAFHKDNFLAMPKSKTSLGSETILLGDVPNNKLLEIEVPLTNEGNGEDSVTVTLGGATALKKVSALLEDHLAVPAGGSVMIRIQVDPTTLDMKTFTLTILADSKCNIDASHMTRFVKFKVIDASDVEGNVSSPESFRLESNVPNPFNPCTSILYTLDEMSAVRLEVYDASGRRVAVLVSEYQSPGEYSVQFDGSSLGSGVYCCVLEAGKRTATQKMMLMK
jgi:outer membrane protein assembly factor BamB